MTTSDHEIKIDFRFTLQIIQTSILKFVLKFFISCPSSALAPDYVWPLVDFWLDVDVSVDCFRDGSDAPLYINRYEGNKIDKIE